MRIMAQRKYVEWDFSASEAGLFKGAYTIEFGNLAYGALLKRAIEHAKSPRRLLNTHMIEGKTPITLPDELVHNILGELEDAGIYDDPGQFKSGKKLLNLVDDCKNLMIEQANAETIVVE